MLVCPLYAYASVENEEEDTALTCLEACICFRKISGMLGLLTLLTLFWFGSLFSTLFGLVASILACPYHPAHPFLVSAAQRAGIPQSCLP